MNRVEEIVRERKGKWIQILWSFASAYDKTVILDLVCDLDTLVEQVHDVAACHKSLDVPVQALRVLELRFLVGQS